MDIDDDDPHDVLYNVLYEDGDAGCRGYNCMEGQRTGTTIVGPLLYEIVIGLLTHGVIL